MHRRERWARQRSHTPHEGADVTPSRSPRADGPDRRRATDVGRSSGWRGRRLLLLALLVAVAAPALLADTDRRGGAPAEASEDGRDASETGPRPPATGSAPADDASAEVTAGEPATGEAAAGPSGATAGSRGAPTRPLARIGALRVRAPALDPVLVGFHEAATPHGLTMQPVGRLVEDRNPSGTAPPADDPAGTPYLVLDPRGEPTPATSAVDVVMRDEDPVLAPVTGWVSDVRDVVLYGSYADQRVEIVPRSAPHLRIVVIHVDGVVVAPGDAVVVGRTVLATTARRFPFASQIDRDTDPEVWPHVHLEVQPRRAPRPGDALEGAEVRTRGDGLVDAAVTARERTLRPAR
jgi:hypothetical protein